MQITQETLGKIFKAYDIRGIVGVDINNELYYLLGKALASFLNAKHMYVGRDFRKSSANFQQDLIKGILETGCDVTDIGEIATEMLYFAVGNYGDSDGGVAVTASHNPSGYNGAKMVTGEVTPIFRDYGYEEIKEMILSRKFRESAKKGTLFSRDIYPDFKKHILTFAGALNLSGKKIIVDAGNGIGGKVFDYVFGDQGIDYEKMFFEPDDNFPNHEANPLKIENIKDLIKKVEELSADLGIALDGDADRAMFVDNKGRNPSGVQIGSLMARYLAQKKGAIKVIHDPRAVLAIRQELKGFGAVPIMVRSGHSFFKDAMRKYEAEFGFEMSSHIYYKNFFYADSGFMTISLMFKMLSEGLDLAKELDYFYDNYFLSGEVNFRVEDVSKTLKFIKNHFAHEDIDETDGVSVTFGDWRFNLRGSNTEPLLRLNVEGYSKEIVREKYKLLESLIAGKRENDPQL